MYIIISILILFISFKLFKKAAGVMSFRKPNMISWVFFYNILLQSFFASTLVINNVDNHYLINKISNESSRFYGWLAVMYTSISLPSGMLLANFIAKKKMSYTFKEYTNKPILPLISNKDSYVKLPLLLLSILSILSILYTFASLSQIPILKMIKGGSAYELAVLRVSSSRGFSGNNLVKNIFGMGLAPILTFVYYTYYKLTKMRVDYFMFIIMFFCSFLILTYNLEKSTFVMFLMGFIFLKVLLEGQISRRFLYYYGGGLLILLVTAYVFVARQVDVIALFSNYNLGILGRVLLSQSAGTYLMFDLFPAKYDFIGFESISSYTSLFFGIDNTDRAARIVMSHITGGNLETAGVMNSLFIGEAWANFGFLGVLIAPIYVGMIIQALFLFLLSMKKSPLYLGLLTYFSYRSSVTGGFNDYLYNMGYIVVVTLILLIYLSGIFLKQIQNTKK